RRAIDGAKRTRRARRQLVERSGNELFPRARFTSDQHTRLRFRHLLDVSEELAHVLAGSENSKALGDFSLNWTRVGEQEQLPDDLRLHPERDRPNVHDALSRRGGPHHLGADRNPPREGVGDGPSWTLATQELHGALTRGEFHSHHRLGTRSRE